jgi:hypothetical protein
MTEEIFSLFSETNQIFQRKTSSWNFTTVYSHSMNLQEILTKTYKDISFDHFSDHECGEYYFFLNMNTFKHLLFLRAYIGMPKKLENGWKYSCSRRNTNRTIFVRTNDQITSVHECLWVVYRMELCLLRRSLINKFSLQT